MAKETLVRFADQHMAELFARAVRRRGYEAHRRDVTVTVKAPRRRVEEILAEWGSNRGRIPTYTILSALSGDEVNQRTLSWRSPKTGKRITLEVKDTGAIVAHVEGERRERFVWAAAANKGRGVFPVPRQYRGKVPSDYAALGRLIGPREVLEAAVALARKKYQAYRKRRAAREREAEARRQKRKEAVVRARRALPSKVQELLAKAEEMERRAAEFSRAPEMDGVALSLYSQAGDLRRQAARMCPHSLVDTREGGAVRTYTRQQGRPAEVETVKIHHRCLVCGYSWTTEKIRFIRWVSEEEYANWLWR